MLMCQLVRSSKCFNLNRSENELRTGKEKTHGYWISNGATGPKCSLLTCEFFQLSKFTRERPPSEKRYYYFNLARCVMFETESLTVQ